MNKNFYNKFQGLLSFWVCVAFSCLFFVSCSDAGKNIEAPDKGNSSDNPIIINANLSAYATSRSYVESGPVTDGFYAMIYRDSHGNNAYSKIDFETTKNGTGYAYTPEGEELKWSNVTTNPPYRFTLDNIPQSISTSTQSVTFGNDNPYVASVLNKDGSNDLLWGVTASSPGIPVINFNLNHIMSLLCVEITVNNDWTGNLNLSNATVEITNIREKLMSFNRNTGVAITAGNGNNTGSTLSLVNPETEPALTWGNETPKDQDVTIYLTQEFVIPPQSLAKGNGRPQLVITIPQEGKEDIVYSGYLPTAMTVGGNTDNPEYFAELEFLSGKFLTIHTSLDSPDRVLKFLPATYVDWVYKGRFPITGFMAGVYDADNFFALLDAIKSKDPGQMKYFGSQREDGQWVFNIWSNLILDNVDTPLKDVDLNFTFELYGHILTIGNVMVNTAEELIKILKGN